MTYSVEYTPFWKRVYKQFLGIFLGLTLIVLMSYFSESTNNNLKFTGFVILGMGVFFIIPSLITAKTYVNDIKFIDDKIIVSGYDFDTRWSEIFYIKTSNIKIKSKSRGRGSVGYYLKITSSDKKDSVVINQTFNWKYNTLLEIFKKFKNIKGEKIISDDKNLLDIIEKKAQGFTSWDIFRGRKIKK